MVVMLELLIEDGAFLYLLAGEPRSEFVMRLTTVECFV